jgi:hypothetical protein
LNKLLTDDVRRGRRLVAGDEVAEETDHHDATVGSLIEEK